MVSVVEPCFIFCFPVSDLSSVLAGDTGRRRKRRASALKGKVGKVTPQGRMDDLRYPSLDRRRKRHLIGL